MGKILGSIFQETLRRVLRFKKKGGGNDYMEEELQMGICFDTTSVIAINDIYSEVVCGWKSYLTGKSPS